MKTIVIGSTNKGKIAEFSQALKPLGVTVTHPLLLHIDDEIEETGKSFEENALIKARGWAEKTNLPALVDDSGLVVDALGGKPGVHSKRFYEGSDHDRNLHLLSLLKHVPLEKRTARYICALAFVDPDKNLEHLVISKCEGKISFELSGNHGFGYDPLFIPEGYSKTFGELPSKVKAKISHRAQALAKMYPFLEQWSW